MIYKQGYICLPPHLNVTVIQQNNKYIFYNYNALFSYTLCQPTDLIELQIDNETKSFCFLVTTVKSFNNLYLNLVHSFLFSWDSYFFEKIKFTGKGYRIAFQKKKKIITFYFGHSHDTIIIFRWIIVKKPHKYKFVILKNNLTALKHLNRKILKIKPINIYTKRGLRNFRQIILKRKGKKSAY